MSDSAEQVIAGAMAVAIHGDESHAEYMVNAADIVADRLRAAGLLPGPDDIVVSREALRRVLVDAPAPTSQEQQT
jgi:hypothetical protein